jgi:type I restriction enzyme M protein
MDFMPRKPKLATSNPKPTTSQTLGTLLKSARDIMRKDKGLNGDLDRLPLLTWIMFLKFLDDLESQRKHEAALAGKKFRPAIAPPYRWRDWAANPQGITGNELLAFINQDEAVRPDGSKGPGLFAYLRQLTSSEGDDRRDVIATVFRGVDNRMKSGYLLRDVINKVANIHFTSSDELHTLGALYESMLREMRDAAGDSGEFYTPRPVVRFMVEVIDPQLGETVLDPAAGTGGFLVEAFNHLSKQVKTVAQRRTLQDRSIFGCEPKSLPYLLCQMNLLLHGLDAPHIDPGNSLRFKLSEIGEKDRVNVIVTNPPFGGEEEKGIQGNFPEDRQTAETALLFLQLIMRRIRREGKGRAAVVVPESVMSDTGVAQRIRRQLSEEFNLHTIVRLPKGVFEPYSDIQTNLLFFDTSKSTDGIWFYQVEVPGARGAMRDPKYTITSPIVYEEFLPIIGWCRDRTASRQAWFVSRSDLEDRGYNFDFRNPNKREKDSASIGELAIEMEKTVGLLFSRLPDVHSFVERMEYLQAGDWPKYMLSKVLNRVRVEEAVRGDVLYKQITVKLYGKGVIERGEAFGKEIKTRPQFRAHAGDLIMSRIDARSGAFGIIPPSLDGAIVTQDFPMFKIDNDVVLPQYLALVLKSDEFVEICKRSSRGTTNRKRLNEDALLSEEIHLPDKKIQQEILDLHASLVDAMGFADGTMKAGSAMERRLCDMIVK